MAYWIAATLLVIVLCLWFEARQMRIVQARLLGLLRELEGDQISGRALRCLYDRRYPPRLFGYELNHLWFGLDIPSFYRYMGDLENRKLVTTELGSDGAEKFKLYWSAT